MGTAKGFASFGGFFVLFECMIEHVRAKDDGVNSFLAGAGTSIVLAANGNCLLISSHGEKRPLMVGYGRRSYVLRLLQSLQDVGILI